MASDEESVAYLLASAVDDAPVDWTVVDAELPAADQDLRREIRIIAALAKAHRRLRKPTKTHLATAISDGELFSDDLRKLPPSYDQKFLEALDIIAQVGHAHRSRMTLSAIRSPITPIESSESPKRWGSLELQTEVGEGGFGTVYKAYDSRLQREVAVKLLRRPHSSASDKVIREARLMARVRHPNVVTVFGAEDFGGVAGIWMEYVDGRSLEHIIRSTGPYSPKEALLIGIDVAKALAAVHAAGLVHGDIKAQNVMRAAGGRTVLMDFGAGREFSAATDETFGITGTPLYMAPEVIFFGESSVQSDIYSLGVLLDHLVTGTFPIDGRTISDVKTAHQNQQRRLLRDARPDLPNSFVQVVERATAADPAKRYATTGAFEVALTKALADSHRSRRATVTKMAAAIAASVVLLIGGGYLGKGRESANASITSIAVLPLDGDSNTAEMDYFSEGVTDLLMTGLARVKPLRVVSRGSTMQLAGTNLPVGDIMTRLGVDAVIDGSVAQEGNRMRVAVKLFHAGSDGPSWNRVYEADIRDASVVQRDAVTDIARRLGIFLTPEQQRSLASSRPVRPEAQDAYFRGRYYQFQTTRQSAEKAVAYFDEAVRIDPSYAPPYAALATSYIILNAFGVMSTDETMGRARAAVQKGLSLDDQLAEMHVAHGDILFLHDWDWTGAEQAFKHAISLNPSYGDAYSEYAWLLAARGRVGEAIQLIRQAEQHDPLSLLMKSNVAGILYYARQFDAAILKCREIIAIDPTFPMAHRRLMQLFAEKKMFAEAQAAGKQAIQLAGPDPASLADFARVHAMAGNLIEAERLMDELMQYERKSAASVTPDRLAFLYAAMGKSDAAFDLLERAIGDRVPNAPWLSIDPHFAPLHGDPRFFDLLERHNLRAP